MNHLCDNLNVEVSSEIFSFTSSLPCKLKHHRLKCFPSFCISGNSEWNYFSMNGNFTFPYQRDFLECFKERIFSSSFNHFLTWFRSIRKLLTVWLMFFPFLKYQFISFSLNSLQNVFRLVSTVLNFWIHTGQGIKY